MIGYILFSPDFNRAILTFFLIIIPEAVFLSTTSLYFDLYVPTISILLTISSLFYLFQISTSDPGYIKKQEFPFTAGPLKAPTIYTALVRDPARGAAIENPYFELVSNSTKVKIKYCRSCWIVRPPRSSHCPECDLCVEKIDHHCPWVGICIGKKNYKKFLGFIYFTNFLGFFNLGCCSVQIADIVINKNVSTGADILENAGASIFLGFFVFLLLIFLTVLGSFHCFLVMKGVTTNEYLKKSFKVGTSPYSRQNCWRNLIELIKQKRVLGC